MDRKSYGIIGERGAESTPITMDVGNGMRSGAQPINVRPTLLFMRQRAILDVDDAIGEFEEPRVVGHDQDSPAVVSGGAREDGHDRLAVGAVERSARRTPFLAAIVSQPHNDRRRHGNGDILSRFMSGGGMARWTCDGAVRAFINPRMGAPQVAFEPLPGGIELASIDTFDLSSTKPCRRTNEATAWYGFGVPISDPADIVLMFRNEISASRHGPAHARRAAHA